MRELRLKRAFSSTTTLAIRRCRRGNLSWGIHQKLNGLPCAHDNRLALGTVAQQLSVLGKSLGDGIDEANNRAAVKGKTDDLSFVVVFSVGFFIGVDRDCVAVLC